MRSNSNKFVYFDLGNVLVTFDHHQAARNLADLSGRSFEEIISKLFVTDLQRRYETGLVSSSQYVAEINAKLDCSLAEQSVLQAISDMFQPNWSILEALELVQSKGTPMGILSNTCEAHWSWLKNISDWRMMHGWFQQVILSYEVKSMKPDAGIYQACERACGFAGAAIFFTDDRIENIQAAADRGWCTHQYNHRSHADLMGVLESWLDG